jgi:hypothetical protein
MILGRHQVLTGIFGLSEIHTWNISLGMVCHLYDSIDTWVEIKWDSWMWGMRLSWLWRFKSSSELFVTPCSDMVGYHCFWRSMLPPSSGWSDQDHSLPTSHWLGAPAAPPPHSGPIFVSFFPFWSLHHEDGCSMDIWNNGILPWHCTESQPRINWLEVHECLNT